jgi:hypothetical protein
MRVATKQEIAMGQLIAMIIRIDDMNKPEELSAIWR